jgi:glycosyltransferase involved in cell wall biosynthesis
LVLIGKLDADIMAARDDTGVEIENHVGISQQALFDQYVAADLVTFISIGEGFGLPIIEAQAMARPLVTANIPPMSVAAGEGACLVDPLDLDSMRGGIVRLINDDAFRNEVIRKGLENVTAYSPETVARQYLKLNQTLYVRN